MVFLVLSGCASLQTAKIYVTHSTKRPEFSRTSLSFHLAVSPALGRDGREEALWVFQRVGGGGEAEASEARRDDPGMRSAPGMERLCHRAEISRDAASLRCRQRDRHRRLPGREAAQRGARRAGADRERRA
jgi:hypothetical protein